MFREEVIDAYKQLGYQVLCLTDHNVIADHSDMNTDDFLMLTGIEINVNAFIYLTVTAADGTYTATRSYFADELLAP